MQSLAKLSLLAFVCCLLMAVGVRAQFMHDQAMTWGPWVSLKTCNGVEFQMSMSKIPGTDDKHHARVRAINKNNFDVQLGYYVKFVSDSGREYVSKETGGIIASLKTAEGENTAWWFTPFEDNEIITSWGFTRIRVKNMANRASNDPSVYEGLETNSVACNSDTLEAAAYPFPKGFDGDWAGTMSFQGAAEIEFKVKVSDARLLFHTNEGPNREFRGTVSPGGDLKMNWGGSTGGDLTAKLRLTDGGNAIEGEGNYKQLSADVGLTPATIRLRRRGAASNQSASSASSSASTGGGGNSQSGMEKMESFLEQLSLALQQLDAENPGASLNKINGIARAMMQAISNTPGIDSKWRTFAQLIMEVTDPNASDADLENRLQRITQLVSELSGE